MVHKERNYKHQKQLHKHHPWHARIAAEVRLTASNTNLRERHQYTSETREAELLTELQAILQSTPMYMAEWHISIIIYESEAVQRT